VVHEQLMPLLLIRNITGIFHCTVSCYWCAVVLLCTGNKILVKILGYINWSIYIYAFPFWMSRIYYNEFVQQLYLFSFRCCCCGGSIDAADKLLTFQLRLGWMDPSKGDKDLLILFYNDFKNKCTVIEIRYMCRRVFVSLRNK
jgi:hypothetical protein